MDIIDYIEIHYPKQAKTGKWGCCEIGLDGVSLRTLQEQHPNGRFVDLSKEYLDGYYISNSTLRSNRYWIWTEED